MINLAAGKCVACRAGEPTLTDAEIEDLLLHIHEWQVKEVDGMKRLEKVFKFKNFAQALEFTNKIGAIAEEESHFSGGRIRLGACIKTISSWLQRLMSW
jgi:4a-hydroxytetrahydrobiopterin dehydratase